MERLYWSHKSTYNATSFEKINTIYDQLNFILLFFILNVSSKFQT